MNNNEKALNHKALLDKYEKYLQEQGGLDLGEMIKITLTVCLQIVDALNPASKVKSICCYVQSRFSGDWQRLCFLVVDPAVTKERYEEWDQLLVEFGIQACEPFIQMEGTNIQGSCNELSDKLGNRIAWLEGYNVLMAKSRNPNIPVIMTVASDGRKFSEAEIATLIDVSSVYADNMEKAVRILNRGKNQDSEEGDAGVF